MAQRKQITWSELRVGLFVLVGLLILAVAIFYVPGAGFLGPNYRLKTFLPEVSGLAVGAPVRLDGVEIGNVEKIRLVPRQTGKPPDRMHNIEVDIRIDARYQGDVLTDSTASLVTEGLLGNRYVNVQRGYTGVPLKKGQASPGSNAKTIKSDIRAGKGTLGTLATDYVLYNTLRDTSSNLSEATSTLNKNDNTAGKLFSDPQLYDNLAAASAELRTFLTEFRKNPKKYLTVKMSFF